MTIKSEKIRDGVFVGEVIVPADDNPSAGAISECLNALFQPFQAEYILDDIEKEISEITADKSSSKVRKSNAEAALFKLKEIRNNLYNDNSKDTFVNTVHMMQSLWKAKIRPFEKELFAKPKRKKGGSLRGEQKKAEAQPEHDRIIELAKPLLDNHSNSNIARILKKNHNVKLTTRQISTILTTYRNQLKRLDI